MPSFHSFRTHSCHTYSLTTSGPALPVILTIQPQKSKVLYALDPAFTNPNPSFSDGVQCNADCRYFENDRFNNQVPGFYGNVGRNTMIGPGFSSFDFSIIKSTYLGSDGSKKVQFRAEFFNLANRASFDTPDSTVFSSSGRTRSTAGRVTNTVGTARQIQLALRFEF